MDGERAARWAGSLLAAALGFGSLALLLWGTVTVGAGDSAGFQRSLREILRAGNRALATTGWSDGWRVAAWACGAAALAAAVPLVWAAARVRDEPGAAAAPGSGAGGEVGAGRAARPNGAAGGEPLPATGAGSGPGGANATGPDA